MLYIMLYVNSKICQKNVNFFLKKGIGENRIEKNTMYNCLHGYYVKNLLNNMSQISLFKIY